MVEITRQRGFEVKDGETIKRTIPRDGPARPPLDHTSFILWDKCILGYVLLIDTRTPDDTKNENTAKYPLFHLG